MKRIIYVTIVLATIFLSCKDDEDDVVNPKIVKSHSYEEIDIENENEKEIARTDLYPANGFITGTVKAVTRGGAYFESTFNYELDMDMQTYTVNALGQYDIHLSKLDRTGTLKDTSRRTEMNFLLGKRRDSLEFLTNYRISTFSESVADNPAVKYSLYFNHHTSRPLMVLKNIVFDVTDGSFSADYYMDHSMFEDEATIEGKIKTKLVNVRYRTGS